MTMKRTIYNYIMLLLAMALLNACSQDTLGELYSGDNETTEISFSLGTPAWTSSTRAGVAGNDASVSSDGKNLQLLCFDANGGFVGVGSEVSSSSAKVPSGTRHIHFLLNYGTTINNPTTNGTSSDNTFDIGTNEKTVMTSLTTEVSTNAVVCWGYISDLTTYNSSTDKVTLVRNVAKICVNNKDTEKQTISSVAVAAYNDYSTGSVAPFDSKNLTNPFTSDNYTNGVPTNFVTVPLDAKRQNNTGISSVGSSDNVFVYECDQTSGEIGVILAVTYSDNTIRYHKIRLCDKDGNLYTIVRNHQYTINVDAKLPKNSGYATISEAIAVTSDNASNMITIDNEVAWTADPLSFVSDNGESLSEITLYPELDMTSSEKITEKSSGNVTKTVKFKYLGSETGLSTSSFTATPSATSGVTAKVTSYSDKVGEITISVANSTLSSSSTDALGTITLSYGNASDVLTINKGTWSDAFTGTINYYSKASDGSTSTVKIKDFTLTHNTITSGTNLRLASKYLVPSSSSSAFNNAYIAATPITGIEYWYNAPTWSSSDLTSLLSQFTYTGGATTQDIYVMADGIKPRKVKWEDKGTEPKVTTIVCTFKVENKNTAIVDDTNTFSLTGTAKNTSSDNNASITVDGKSYDCSTVLKMETNTAISFTLSQVMTLRIYFGSTSSNKNIKVDNKKYDDVKTDSDGKSYVEIPNLSASAHTITKADGANVALLYLTTATD